MSETVTDLSRRSFLKKAALAAGALALGAIPDRPLPSPQPEAARTSPLTTTETNFMPTPQYPTATPTARHALKPEEAKATATSQVVEDIKTGAATATPRTRPTATPKPDQRTLP